VERRRKKTAMTKAPDLFRLDGRVAFVTGAASGIGLAIATGIAEMGGKVGLADRSDEVECVAEELAKAGHQTSAVCVDVRDEAAIGEAVAAVERELGGRVTLAVNSAGIARGMPALDMPTAEWQEMLDIDLTGVFLSCRVEARSMREAGGGAIVNIASMSGTIANRDLTQAHYNAAKAGVVHLTKSLAMEWLVYGIRVNSISPGYTATPMNLRPDIAEQVKRFEDQTPMARMARPDEMTGPAIFLLSEASSYCTGVDLLVDGGVTCW
jgi:NAD(P)-dependent dehydrogenase (short-subunit alcohol dehydrogenase family)